MVTRADLESIVSAVPSFRAKWNQWQETLEDSISVEFSFYMTQHLVERATSGDFTDFSLLFAALEAPLSDPTTELYDALTMGFLEDLIHLCERKGISLERVANCITGTRTREEWNWAYKYTRADRETNHGGSTRH